MTAIEQMVTWIEKCEQAARDNDIDRLVRLIARVNVSLDTEFLDRAGANETLMSGKTGANLTPHT